MDGETLWSQEDYDEREEFARNVKISLLGVSPSLPGTFRPSGDSIASDWETWAVELFRKIIGPVFRDSFMLGSELKLRETADLDRILGKNLGEKLSERLILASVPFIEGKEEMRGHQNWQKYIRMVESSEAPGHLPVIFALHSLLFRMPLASALLAYAWLEWKTGHFFAGKAAQAGNVEEPPGAFLIVRDQIATILNVGEDEEEDRGLRVV